MREVEDLIELHNRYGTRLHTVVSGDDDLSTADGRMTARIKASVDAAEAERTSERARRAKQQAAVEGRHRGGPRPFGWESDGMTVRESEARVLLEATRGVLAGRTLAALHFVGDRLKRWIADQRTLESNCHGPPHFSLTSRIS